MQKQKPLNPNYTEGHRQCLIVSIIGRMMLTVGEVIKVEQLNGGKSTEDNDGFEHDRTMTCQPDHSQDNSRKRIVTL